MNEINRLFAQAIDQGGISETALKAQHKLQLELGFDDLNWKYFFGLYLKKFQPNKREKTRIFEDGIPTDDGVLNAYPTAIASKEMLAHLPHADYATLLKSPTEYTKAARNAVLWIKKMQAGTGSSMTRAAYLAQVRGIPEPQVKIGAKGTDLYISVKSPDRPGHITPIPLAEVQILQAIHDAQSGRYSKIIWHDILSSETRESVQALWSKPSWVDQNKNYFQLIDLMPQMHCSGSIEQSHVPTIGPDGHVTLGRTAPAGHGIYAVDALRAAYIDTLRPVVEVGQHLVCSIGNGEDLGSTPDPTLVGWMVKERIPIAMLTTEKTSNDLKGGQIALVDLPGRPGAYFATIIEQAQAKESKQLALFEKLGTEIRRDGQIAFFNTNMALFNYSELAPKITRLVSEIGEAAFLQVICPDLIENRKGDFLQLEGAMGSSILNLDRFWRERFDEPLVHFINIDSFHRTRFFSPVKSAWDYFMQFHSDRFGFDEKTMRQINHREGHLPSIALHDNFYADVTNVLAAFRDTSILNLDALEIQGKAAIPSAIFRGHVKIRNKSPRLLDLTEMLAQDPRLARATDGRPIFENITIDISLDGVPLLKVHPNSG